MTSPTSPQAFASLHDALRRNVETALRGKGEVVRLALTCLFSGGHLLVEDVPGVGKTSLAKALADSLEASWNRIQFTPDLLPSDITGTSVWDARTSTFEFREGAVFAHVVVGDEINRASPKTQSALLEVMEEQQVTIDAVAHPVPTPFMVLATQNPIDLAGTYRLPEAQLDRFLMRVSIGYPDAETEQQILQSRSRAAAVVVSPVASVADVRSAIAFTGTIYVAEAVSAYVVAIAAATRNDGRLLLGMSTRASLALLRAAQSWAAGEGRNYVTPDDVKALVPHVVAHRLQLSPEAEVRGSKADEVLAEIIARVPAPAHQAP